MAEPSDLGKAPALRFGAFELFQREGVLRKHGTRIRLQQKPHQALALLLRHPGVLVTRQELQKHLWASDTFVEFEDSLNHAIKRLRDALSDSAEDPRFIETIPGRGYRFIAPVERLDATGEIVGLPAGTGTRRTISRYRLLEKLGEGGMGVVYKAEDPKLQRNVALKLLAPHLTEDPKSKARFLREAQAAATVDHPNICTIHEIDEVGGQTFISMAYVEGQTLDRKIETGEMALREALEIATEVALGLEAAHHKGIVHRDIKGANIMITEARPGVAWQVKVMDFGLARLLDQRSLTSGETALGTLSYAAPEQARGEPVDQRADIWSLGVVLYQMVSGRLPFQGETDAAVLYAILHNDPEPVTSARAGVPIEIEDVIEKALAKDPGQRYQDVGELVEDLGSIQQRLEVPGGAKALQKRAAKRKPLRTVRLRRRWAWALGIAAAAAVLTMAGLAGWNFLPTAEAPLEPPELIPFTSYEGNELAPSFSPDGNQIAFGWNGPQQDNEDIYVKLIGTETPLRLTTDPRFDGWPTFSPDGRSIVFMRQLEGEKAGVFVVPALGGPERQLTEALFRWRPVWSPDGNYLVVVDRVSDDGASALVAFSLETGEKRTLTRPAPSGGVVLWPAFSPDGRTLAFFRQEREGAVYLLDLDENLQPTGEERQLTPPQWRGGFPAWTADGSEVVFTTDRNEAQHNLVRVAALGGEPRAGCLGWQRLDARDFQAREPSSVCDLGRRSEHLAHHGSWCWRPRGPPSQADCVQPRGRVSRNTRRMGKRLLFVQPAREACRSGYATRTAQTPGS